MVSANSYQLNRASLCEFPTQSVRWQVSPGKSAIYPSIYPHHALSTDFGSKDFVLRRRLVHLSLASLEVRVPRARGKPSTSFWFRVTTDTLALSYGYYYLHRSGLPP